MAKREMVLSLSEMVKHLLRAHDVPFEVWDRSDYLTILHAVVASGFGGGGQLARVVFLRDEAGLVMALLSDPEDTGVPARRLGRDLVPTRAEAAERELAALRAELERLRRGRGEALSADAPPTPATPSDEEP